MDTVNIPCGFCGKLTENPRYDGTGYLCLQCWYDWHGGKKPRKKTGGHRRSKLLVEQWVADLIIGIQRLTGQTLWSSCQDLLKRDWISHFPPGALRDIRIIQKFSRRWGSRVIFKVRERPKGYYELDVEGRKPLRRTLQRKRRKKGDWTLSDNEIFRDGIY